MSQNDFANYVLFCATHFPADSSRVSFGKPLCSESIYGLEVKYLSFALNQLAFDVASMLATCKILGIDTFVFLERRNALRRILSNLIAEHTGIYHATSPNKEPTQVILDTQTVSDWGFSIKPQSLLEALEHDDIVRTSTRAHFANANALCLTYEEHIEKGLSPSLAFITERLGLQYKYREPRWKRQNAYSLSQLLANYPDVSALLAESRFRHMLTTS